MTSPRPSQQRLIVGNWKMNLAPAQGASLASSIAGHEGVQERMESGTTVVVCPPTVTLHRVQQMIDGTQVQLGAQDGHHEPSGAYTGDVSMQMLGLCGCSYVIVGHSERRRYHNETNELVNRKALAAQQSHLTPIICIGESLEERKDGSTKEVITRQIMECVQTSTSALSLSPAFVVAYEPVWAIGTGLAATIDQIDEVHTLIQELLARAGFEEIRVLYGGSVTASNAGEIFACQAVHGALVGGASLNVESFAGIIAA